ncbi:MAG: hypothetical protein R3181_09495 [Rubricoccaceae bacterium]|nr:hypothetical protein [Rubricoccaceae bacterium]
MRRALIVLAAGLASAGTAPAQGVPPLPPRPLVAPAEGEAVRYHVDACFPVAELRRSMRRAEARRLLAPARLPLAGIPPMMSHDRRVLDRLARDRHERRWLEARWRSPRAADPPPDPCWSYGQGDCRLVLPANEGR